ncbi:MAG: hypothetical protein VXX36_13000 [Verrucomicrobiota bacterium]|nr:hypothetical protein [Verrucomicrobiota bacterium]
MSDTEPQKPKASTSTVPLKKETVRISLRAPVDDSGPVAPKGSTEPISTDIPSTAPVAPPPAGGAPTPPQAPSAPTPPAAAPAAPVGAKTIPLAKAPDPLGPTKPVPTTGASGAATPVGAKTIPLAKAPVSGGPGPVGKATVPLQQPGGAKPLPQATVKMGQTQPMAQSAPTSQLTQKPNIQSTAAEVEDEWDEEYEESGLMPFAIIVLILALVVLGIELMTKMGVGG